MLPKHLAMKEAIGQKSQLIFRIVTFYFHRMEMIIILEMRLYFFEKNGILYEVSGSHCSCYGLEDQWEPEETSIESLEHRYKEGHLGTDDWTGNMFRDELLTVINFLKNK
jgi:hypothetical protein